MNEKSVWGLALTVLMMASMTTVLPAHETTKNQPRRTVAITFDDLPAVSDDLKVMQYVTTNLLRRIEANQVRSVGFVNEGKLFRRGEVDARIGLLRQWLEAGQELGNHTFSHINNAEVPIAEYAEDLTRGETITRMLLKEEEQPLRYFRHPYLRTGPTPEYKLALEQLLVARGYTIAPVTIDNNEYIFAAVYSDAKAREDLSAMKRIADAYIVYMNDVFAHFEELSKGFLGYEVAQTLLLHANELNADHFGALVRMLRTRGYELVTLEEALADDAYKLEDAQSPRGLSWIHRWMLAKGLEMRPEPSEPKWIADLFANR